MKKRTLMTTLMVAALLCGGAVVPAVQAHADTTTQASSSSSSTTSTTHTISKSYVVYGAGAPESAYSTLNSTMGVDSSFTVSMSRYRSERAAVALTAVMIIPFHHHHNVRFHVRIGLCA